MYDQVTGNYLGSIGRKSGVDSYTKLLLHMDGDGTNGHTDFTDYSDSGHTVTAGDDAQGNIGTVKFGTASCQFDGNGDYLSIPDHADWVFGTAAFTIDMWMWRNTNSATFFSQYVDATHCFYLVMTAAENIVMKTVLAPAGQTDKSVDGSSFTTGGWHHIAFIRGWGGSNNNMAVTINGTSIVTWDVTGVTFADQAATVQIGEMHAGTFDNTGMIDEYRISKGIARWTENFNPPIRAY